ncbi:acyltransferase [uncultured Algibacter sp.]|uniref:acyltransferase family protein n=1 Tax=uncultured Algibacter sp. TaxID=298659 RepID=UPI00262901AD|nr:acyltransferase [uncultured Algibacter sp.]
MQQPTFSRLLGLDCLRALAISLVVLSHITFLLYPNTTSTLIDFVRIMGAIGVDLFFVLSGYLIGGILLKILKEEHLQWSSLIRFWKRRWLRTLPNYFLVLILNVVGALIVGTSLPKDVFLYSFFFQNFASEHPDFFTEAWSLSIEEFAYLLLPFFLFLSVMLFKKGNRQLLFFRTTLLIIIMLTIFKIFYYFDNSITTYHEWSTSFRKVVIYRMDSIYYGFIVLFLVKNFPNFITRKKNILLILGLASFALLHIFVYVFNLLPQSHFGFYVFIYLQIVGISLALLFPYFLNLKRTFFGQQLIEFISKRSYAIYLVNYSLVLLNIELLFDIYSMNILEKTALVILFLLMTTVISNIMYVYFENPILKFRDRKFPR